MTLDFRLAIEEALFRALEFKRMLYQGTASAVPWSLHISRAQPALDCGGSMPPSTIAQRPTSHYQQNGFRHLWGIDLFCRFDSPAGVFRLTSDKRHFTLYPDDQEL